MKTTGLRLSCLWAAVAGVLLATVQTGFGRNEYLNTWNATYPASSSANIVQCALCHASTVGGEPWNPYGWSIRQAYLEAGSTNIAAAIQSVAGLDADGEGNSNLAEITANTLPGWRTGNNNTFFFINDSTMSGNAPIPEAMNPDPVFYTLSFTTPVNGSITGASSGQQFGAGQVANLTAAPAEGFAFAGWTGNVPLADVRDSTLALTMNVNRSLVAHFYKNTGGVLAYSEALSGDLSGVPGSPTPVTLSLGANALTSQMGNNGNTGATNNTRDADYFVVTVPAGRQISSITIDSFTFSPSDPGESFGAYVAAATFAGQQAGNIAGHVLFNASSGEVLDDLAGGPLGPGTYAFWFQETSANVVDYQLTLTLGVPPPILYTLSLSGPNGSIAGSTNGQQFVSGQVANLEAAPSFGFEFVRWLVDGVASIANPLAVTMDADVAVTAEFASVANTTGPANGFSDSEVAALEAFLTQLRVGDTVSLSLPVTLAPGTRLVVTGLPAGLTFNASTRTITGTVLAELGDGAVSVQIRTVATNAVVESISLRFVVLPFLFAGAYEAIIENASNVPVGRVRLTVTSPTSTSAVLELINEKGLVRTISGTRITFGVLAGNVLPANLSFPVVPAPSSLLATTAVINLEDPSVSDLVTGTQGSVPNTLRGFRLVRPGRSPVQPVTVAFENGTPGDRLLTPGGSGFGTGTVSGSGVLPLTGSLGDGQSFTTTLRLSETNQAVVWMQPYTNKVESFLGGIIDVGSLVIPGRGGPSPSTPIADGLRWAKSVRAAEKSYPGGFGVAAALGGAPTTPLAVDGFVSKWFAVGSVQGLANTLGLTARNLNATYVAPPMAPQLPVGRALPTQFNLRGAFSLVRLTPANSVGWSGTAVPTNGRFKGSPVLVTPLPASVRGVFLQDPQSGAPTKVGVGFMRIPTNGTGSFQTSGVRFDQ